MKKYLLLLFPVVIVFLDRFSKNWIVGSYYYGESEPIIGNFLRFTYIRNPNGVFGIHIGGRNVSLILTIIAFLLVIYLFIISHHTLFSLSLSFIIGGAMGNLWDRFIYKEVVDFIDMGIGHYRWFTFNIADSFVVIGIILALIFYIMDSRRSNAEAEIGK